MARPTDESGTTIPTAPRPPGTGHRPPHHATPPPASTPSPSTSSGGSKPMGSGHAKDPYAAAQRRADAKEQQARQRAAKKWLGQAATMQQQINALRVALGSKGLRRALRVQLENVGLAVRQQDAELTTGYRERVRSLRNTADDNEKAAAGQTNANLDNRSRERQNAISEATLQGAGESDLLRAQGASLRNWNANQNEVNRSFYDTLTSVNSSLTDLTVDTRTARINAAAQANADRSGLWTDYYANRSETLTQLGNALGQQAEYYGLANEATPKKNLRRQQRQSSRASGNWFERASTTSGMAWHSPGVKKSLRHWQGADDVEGFLNSEVRPNAQTEIATKKPEGATLRTWAK